MDNASDGVLVHIAEFVGTPDERQPEQKIGSIFITMYNWSWCSTRLKNFVIDLWYEAVIPIEFHW